MRYHNLVVGGQTEMHKFYRPYMYFVIAVAAMLSLFTLAMYEIRMTTLAGLIVTYGMMLEVVPLRYSQNKSVSFLGAVTIFAIFIFNPAMCVLIVTMSLALETCVITVIRREPYFSSKSKLLYNWAMRIICILTAKAVYVLMNGWNTVAVIIGTVSLYSIVNVSLLTMIIYLYTNDKDEARFQSFSSTAAFIYINTIIDIIMVYGYEAYGIKAIITIYMLLLPAQISILGKTVFSNEIETLIFTDPLTKVFNRASLSKVLTDNLSIKKPFTIIFIDFDNFKFINDNYGHDVGDKILQHFTDKVKSSLRKTDKLYRFGGDEFCLVIDKDYDVRVVTERISKLKDNLSYEYESFVIPYAFSMGTFKYTGEDTLTEEEVIGTVSHKMLENKLKMQMNMA